MYRFGAVVYPLRASLISSKLCPLYILATWIVASIVLSPYLFALKFVENPGGLVCQWHWNEVLGESSTFENYFASVKGVIYFIPLVLIAILYTFIYLKLKSQKSPGEQSANVGQQRQQREQNVLKDGHFYCVRICNMLPALRYQLFSPLVCIGHTILWLHFFSLSC